ncbi:MAG TPA: transketolase C-terminal domain-containing protein, partial [Clostridia bacterium]|nr:transketolase C-terminal domain-containing protein [Clostridia bacterium]
GLGNIAPSQADYYQATRGGGNGDYRTVVLAPATIQEAADFTQEAFDIADYYRTPVVVLADGMIGQMMEAIEWRKPKERALPPKDWATDGTRGKRPHNIINSLYIDAKDCAVQNRKLQEKYDRITETEVRYEEFMAQDAEILFVAYGTTARIARAAVLKLRKDGVKAGLFRPVTLWPFPEKALRECAAHENVAAVIDVELSMGQMIDDVKIALAGAKPVRFVGMGGGAIPAPQELVDEAYKALGRCGK